MEDAIELIRRVRNGDKEAREQLILDNIPLVWSIVGRFSNRGHELQDLFQIGSIGLMKAIDKFDISFDVKFSTYAVPMITGEIKRFLRDDGMIKVSRSMKETAVRVRVAGEELGKKLGREATVEEISSYLDTSTEDVVMAVAAVSEVESLYKTIYQGDGNPVYLLDKLEREKDEQTELVDKMALYEVLESLEKKEQEIIHLRYFQERTQSDIAKILGISQVQVSRLEKRILKKMKEKFA